MTPPDPPKPTTHQKIRQELLDIVGLLRAHVQAQADLGLDACLPPPDDWLGWQREGLSTDDIDWADRPPTTHEEKPKKLADVAADMLGIRAELQKKPKPASQPTAATLTPAKPPPAAASAPLLAQGLFQEALHTMKQASVLDAKPTPATLPSICEAIKNCQKCPLYAIRKQPLPGAGDPTARVMVVTPPPTPEDDQAGQLLSGEAGDLFDKILKAMGLTRAQIYMTPILKCATQKPDPSFVLHCEAHLNQQLEVVHPEVLIALGDLASKTLMRSAKPLPSLRGMWGTFRDIPVMPTLDPAYLLAHPDAKQRVWQDMKEVMRRLGLTPAPPR